MAIQDLEKNCIYELPVKGVKREKNNSYYLVEVDGKKYAVRQYPFQKKEPTPETLACLFRETSQGQAFLAQDIVPLLQRFYQVGEIYPFQVRKDLTDIAEGYYQVADRNGFSFKIKIGKKIKLTIHQTVYCKFKCLAQNKIFLRFMPEMPQEKNQAFASQAMLLQTVCAQPAQARWLKGLLLKAPFFQATRTALWNNDSEWAMVAVGTLAGRLPEWGRRSGKRQGLLLELYRKSCLYLLEDSGYLRQCDEAHREAHVQTLLNALQGIDEFQEALRLVKAGEEGAYIDALFAKMSHSDYLSQAEYKLHVLELLYTLNPELWEEKFRLLPKILLKGDPKRWLSAPYRNNLLSILNGYIEKNRLRFDRTAGIECQEEERDIRLLITALAIGLLLEQGESPSGCRLRQAMLYRYLTYLKGSVPEVLLEKAFATLAGADREKPEFDWKDLRETTLLTIRLSYPPAKEEKEELNAAWIPPQGKTQLRIADGSIRLLLAENKRNARPYLPEGLLPWHNLQACLPGAERPDIPAACKELNAYKRVWKNLECNLLHNEEKTEHKREKLKIKPDVNDQVLIRVTKQDPYDPDRFFCRIEDEVYQGTGTLHIKDIVRYNPNADISAFYSDSGKPFLLAATVASVDKEGEYTFRLMELLGTFIYQGVYVGENVQCLITEYSNGNYACICNFGYSVYVPQTADMPELQAGSCIEVEISEVYRNGYVKADFVQTTSEVLNASDAFANLLFNYANEQVYEEELEEEEATPTGTVLEADAVSELMFLIDRVAVLERDYIKSYNYMGFARLLALLTGNSRQEVCYAQRMKAIEIRQQFVINGKMDMEMMDTWKRECNRLFDTHPLLRSERTGLQILAGLGNPKQDAFLWETMQGGGNEQQQRLARLVLAFNLLGELSVNEPQTALHHALNEALNMDVGKHVSYSFGREDQHTEFKSSIVYPAQNNMRPDLQKQTMEIMSTICGFLNADGGTLYLGVNDQGVACGLASDIEYFKESTDKFDLHVRNHVVRCMGTEANSKISTFYPFAGGKLVYAMKIEPSRYPIACCGTYYQRQGSSTWILHDDSLEAFLQSRERLPRDNGQSEEGIAPAEVLPTLPAEAETETESEAESLPTTTAAESAPAVKDHTPEPIATSRIRPNVTHSWMEGYEPGTVRYLHLLDGNDYIMTEDECWRNDIKLSLAIREEETDGYLVVVFESGRAVKVAMNELMDKKTDKEYKRYAQEAVVFACPAQKDDALLIVTSDTQNRPSYRLDDMKNLKNGNMLAKGEFLSTPAITGVLLCDIIPADRKEPFKKIHNLPTTSNGLNLNVYWGGNELEILKEMGITIPE